MIHAVGPRWTGGERGEREKLASCYRTALALAREKQCESIAFPLISSGVYGYPKDQALRVAVETISEFVLEYDMMVYLVIFGRKDYQISEKLFTNIASYIKDNYVDAHTDDLAERRRRMNTFRREPWAGLGHAAPMPKEEVLYDGGMPAMPSPAAKPSLQEAIDGIDESFSEMLLRKIDESGMTDAACYKKANIDRKLFSKIRGDRLYRPSKPTAIAFAIALELPLDETADLLRKAGFALSPSDKFDIIIRYFIERGNYDIFAINEALFAFDQSLLGA